MKSKSLLFIFALVLLFGSQAQAQISASEDDVAVPPTVYYRNGRPFVPGYIGGIPRVPPNTVQVGRRPYYFGYPYGYGPAVVPDENTVVVGQPYYGYGYYGYGYAPGAYNEDSAGFSDY